MTWLFYVRFCVILHFWFFFPFTDLFSNLSLAVLIPTYLTAITFCTHVMYICIPGKLPIKHSDTDKLDRLHGPGLDVRNGSSLTNRDNINTQCDLVISGYLAIWRYAVNLYDPAPELVLYLALFSFLLVFVVVVVSC